MPIQSSTFTSGEPDQNLLHTIFFVEQVSLLLVIQFALANLLFCVFKPVGHLLPSSFLGMSIGSVLAVMCSAMGLFFMEIKHPWRIKLLGKPLAGLSSLIAVASGLATASAQWPALRLVLYRHPLLQRFPSEPASAICFLLLGIGILLIHSRESLGSHIADAVAASVGFLVLIITSQRLFSYANAPGATTIGLPSFPTFVCLGLLTLVVILRRAENGIFSVFLGDGIGGRTARILAPIIFLIPLMREVGRARLLHAALIPASYATAVLTSTTIAVGFALLILLSRLISSMQTEIQTLTLRDELTGLYSYRGFNLFAEQAFRLAKRAGQSYGVLFIDMDNLKVINDELGHHAGSTCLIEIGKLLVASFRETDVIGRLGGDEFVVAGQFDTFEMSDAIERIHSSASKSHIPGVHMPLSLSMGYAVTNRLSDETMKSLVSRADKAMYKEKRRKKGIFEELSLSSDNPNAEKTERLASASRMAATNQ